MKTKNKFLENIKKVRKEDNKNNEYKINRFPICEIVYYVLAKKAYGNKYNNNQLMALAHTIAVFYAVAKNKGGFIYSNKNNNTNNNNSYNNKRKRMYNYSKKKIKPDGELEFFGFVFSAKYIDNTLYPVFSNKVITEKDFMRSLTSKLTDDEIKAIIMYAYNYVNNLTSIRNDFNVYKRVRDKWRTYEFWNELMYTYYNDWKQVA